MHNHPLNLAVRFVLEILLLFIFGYWGGHQFEGAAHYFLALGLPLLAALGWGLFRVEGDPGKAPVAIPGWLRLLYEVILFAAASFMVFSLGLAQWAYLFIAVSVLHYLISYKRIIWLLQH